MVYNRLYDILPQVAENGDLETLAASRGMERDELRKLLASLDEGIPASLYSTLDRDSVVLSPVGQAYAAACAKASRLFRQAELKAESVKRERESCLIVATLSKGAGRAIRQATSCKVKTILFDSLGDDAPARLKALGADFDLAIGLITNARGDIKRPYLAITHAIDGTDQGGLFLPQGAFQAHSGKTIDQEVRFRRPFSDRDAKECAAPTLRHTLRSLMPSMEDNTETPPSIDPQVAGKREGVPAIIASPCEDLDRGFLRKLH